MLIRTAPLLLALCLGSLAGATETSKLGTGVTWEASPDAAFTKARRTGKLVFLMHLSGNFDNKSET